MGWWGAGAHEGLSLISEVASRYPRCESSSAMAEGNIQRIYE